MGFSELRSGLDTERARHGRCRGKRLLLTCKSSRILRVILCLGLVYTLEQTTRNRTVEISSQVSTVHQVVSDTSW